MEWEKIIELTFKVVMILASLGLVLNLFKKVFISIKGAAKKLLFRFENVEQRLTIIENKLNRRKTKTTKNKNGEKIS